MADKRTKKKAFDPSNLPDTLYVQSVEDGDDSYLVAYENVDDIDLDNGNVVGVYHQGSIVRVKTQSRITEEIG